MRPTYFVPIAGTWDWDEDKNKYLWYEEGSPFVTFMNDNNFFLRFPDCPFEWSTGLEGLPFTKFRQWKAGGRALGYYLDNKLGAWPLEDKNIIAHSYGLYVALYYAAWGGKINSLISIGSPIRNDMKAIALLARPNIGKWLHLRDDRIDLVGVMGQMFDSGFSLSRMNSWSHREDSLGHIGHSDLIKKPEKFHHWLEADRLEVLRNVPS